MHPSTSRSAPERLLQRLDWQVIRRLDGILQGDYRTLFYGSGLDLADLREYQPGDDTRQIDWNVTARMATPYVRLYTEDREITAWFLLDLSPSVDFGTTDNLERDRLIEFSAVLARLLTRHGNRVGAILYDGVRERMFPARSGRMHVLRLIDELQRQPRLPSAPFTDLRVLLASAYRVIRRRSLIFVVSDFISTPGWEDLLALLSRRHEVLAVRLWDPREFELPDIGMVMMQDSETREQLFVDTHNPGFRRRFHEAGLRRQASLQEAFRRSRVDVLSVSTEGALVGAIVEFAARRRQKKHLARIN